MTFSRVTAILASSAASLILALSVFAERHVSCSTLPAAVMNQAKTEAGDATIRGCVQERENAKLAYEVETLKQGKSRDIELDATGAVDEIQQEIPAATLPQAVSDAIAKAAGGGQVGKIESVTKGNIIASYETTIVKNGKRREIAFTPQGTPVKAD